MLFAALHALGMHSLSDVPSSEVIPKPSTSETQSKEEKKKCMWEDCSQTNGCRLWQKPVVSKVMKSSTTTGTFRPLGASILNCRIESDGKQVLLCWKYLLDMQGIQLAFQLLHQYHHSLSTRLAQQLIWSRFVNTHGVCCLSISTKNTLIDCAKLSSKAWGYYLGKMTAGPNSDEDNRVAGFSGSHSPPPFEKSKKKRISQLQHECAHWISRAEAHCFPHPKNTLHIWPALEQCILKHTIAAHCYSKFLDNDDTLNNKHSKKKIVPTKNGYVGMAVVWLTVPVPTLLSKSLNVAMVGTMLPHSRFTEQTPTPSRTCHSTNMASRYWTVAFKVTKQNTSSTQTWITQPISAYCLMHFS